MSKAQLIDPMAPSAVDQTARTSPMRAVTVATSDLARARRFYSGVLGMVPTVQRVTGPSCEALRAHWGLPKASALEIALFAQPFAKSSGILRVVVIDPEAPVKRPHYDSKFLGPLGFGFPIDGLGEREQMANAMGFASSAGIRRMDFPRADGSTYNVGEIHFLAPDDILVLGVDRGEMDPVGPIDRALSIGGVAYASVMVDDIGEFGRFLGAVLGLEQRRRMSFQSPGADGGMRGLDPGESIAFQQWFSPGSTTGYLVVMQRLEGERVAGGAVGMGGRGVGMWTFETTELDEVVERYGRTGGVTEIRTLDLPGFGVRRSAIFTSREGIVVELVDAEDKT